MRFLTLTLALAACAPSPEVQAILDLEADEAAGGSLYADHCAECHGESGEGGTAGPIDHPHSDASTVRTILEGNATMPAFGDQLQDQDIADLNAYVQASIYR
jgi:mono/diheme cytochrome c family protein